MRSGLRAAGAAYVVMVAALATWGFVIDSSRPILLAAALTLPSSVPGMIGYYMAVGLLAQVPGANPDTASGSGSCSANGVCSSASTGDAATWWLLTSDALGVLALALAALGNVWLAREVCRAITRSRRAPSG